MPAEAIANSVEVLQTEQILKVVPWHGLVRRTVRHARGIDFAGNWG